MCHSFRTTEELVSQNHLLRSPSYKLTSLFTNPFGHTVFPILFQDKFRLDLNEEEAVHYMQSLIDVSATAVMAAIVERIHKFAQFWRN